MLDPDALTLGFARRFTGYKRPNLLLENLARLSRLLNDPARPVQLVLAGKAIAAGMTASEIAVGWWRRPSRVEIGTRDRVLNVRFYH